MDASLAWFRSERWQRMEREADEDIAAGRVWRFHDVQSFIAWLEDSDREKLSRTSRDTDRLSLNDRSQAVLKPPRAYQVDRTSKEVIEKIFEPHILVERRQCWEIDQNVDVAVRTCLISRDRAKK
jgi:hypothetical protein